MKKTYQKSFDQIKDFLKKGKLDYEPKAMYYINSPTLSLLNTAKSISNEKKIPVEKVTSTDLLKSYFNLSNSISDSLSSAFDNYIKLNIAGDILSRRENENLKKEIQRDLANFLVTIKDFLDSCGALEHLKIQHNFKMGSLRLHKLAVTQEQIDSEFDFSKNSHTALPTLLTKSAFWANKAVKYIENLKVSILLFEKDHLSYTKNNYESLSDNDKITAIYKEEILTKFRNDMCEQLPDNYTFNNLLLLYSAVIQCQQNPASDVPPLGTSDLPHIDQDKAVSLIEQLSEFNIEYDNVFAPNSKISAFSCDMYSVSNNFSLEDDLYDYKNMLLALLSLELTKQKTLASPYLTHFGNSADRNSQVEVLNVDLPNYFMPASFHYDKKLLERDTTVKRLPKYKGFFNTANLNESIPTYILFSPSTEQKKYIRDEFRKAKSQPDSYRTKLLSQMNAMSNGKWQEFDNLMNKQQQH